MRRMPATKLRFEALHNDTLFESDSDLQIRVGYNKEARTLTISDNGIGMSRDEVINNLGTIAKSGTREFFLETERRPAERCGFDRSVRRGFLFRVHRADKVVVTTRRAGEQADQACAGNRTAAASSLSRWWKKTRAAARSRCICALIRTICSAATSFVPSSTNIPTISFSPS